VNAECRDELVAIHEVDEATGLALAPLTFALAFAQTPEGVVVVFNARRKMWELPGGWIDPGETARDAAAREFREETGYALTQLEWVAAIELRKHWATEPPIVGTGYGALYRGVVVGGAQGKLSREIDAVGHWRAQSPIDPVAPIDLEFLHHYRKAICVVVGRESGGIPDEPAFHEDGSKPPPFNQD
jgi:8-oxo-dGTP pyrophosphatase MutT (NUDIX family)